MFYPFIPRNQLRWCIGWQENFIQNSSGKNKMVSDAVSEAVQLIEPPHATTKGRPKRLKSSREKAQKKDRLCRGCNQRGVSHDKRNCPALLNR